MKMFIFGMVAMYLLLSTLFSVLYDRVDEDIVCWIMAFPQALFVMLASFATYRIRHFNQKGNDMGALVNAEINLRKGTV